MPAPESSAAHTSSVTEVEFQLPSITITGLRSNSGGRHRLLAVHGWLDNASSFVPLIPLLNDVDIVAIDLPGHGHSDHLAANANYHFIDIMYSVFDVANQLGWDTFTLLGHSLGACIAPFVAIANPQPLSSIIMLEATGPLTEPPSDLPARLQRCMQDRSSEKLRRSRTFSNIDEAIDARQFATTMTRDSARLIVERQLIKTDEGYRWRFDPRHRMASPLYMVEEQVIAVLEEVTCPVLTVTANEGYLNDRAQTQPRLQSLKNATHQRVPGHHHMHMDDPDPTAVCINGFLSGRDG